MENFVQCQKVFQIENGVSVPSISVFYRFKSATYPSVDRLHMA